jgi:hypothetical protein
MTTKHATLFFVRDLAIAIAAPAPTARMRSSTFPSTCRPARSSACSASRARASR